MQRPLFGLVIFAFVASPARADLPAPATPVVVPFEMLAKGRLFSGHIAVQVKINDKGPYRLIFDTGAPTMLLTTKVAKECGLIGPEAKKPAIRAPLALPGQVTIRKLEIGSLAAKNLPAIVLDHPTVSAIADMFGPIEGIVGFPFFARYRTSIDYQAKQFTFVPNGYEPADVVMSLMTSLMARSADRNKPQQPKMLVPAGQWGLSFEKGESDENPGVTVIEVMGDSAAARAGIRKNDRILKVDGRWTDSIADAFTASSTVKPGQVVEVVLLRQDQELHITMAPLAGF